MATEVRRVPANQVKQKEVIHFNETVTLAKLGCQRSITELWNSNRELAVKIARKYVDNEFEVDDIVSLAMVRVFSKLSAWDGTGSFASWVSVVIKRVALSYIKDSRRKTRNVVELENASDRHESFEMNDFLAEQIIHSLINKLPKSQRRVIDCMVVQGMTQNEAARALGTTIGTVKSNIFEAKHRLRQMCIEAGLRQ